MTTREYSEVDTFSAQPYLTQTIRQSGVLVSGLQGQEDHRVDSEQGE